jgi:hypothetical protein
MGTDDMGSGPESRLQEERHPCAVRGRGRGRGGGSHADAESLQATVSRTPIPPHTHPAAHPSRRTPIPPHTHPVSGAPSLRRHQPQEMARSDGSRRCGTPATAAHWVKSSQVKSSRSRRTAAAAHWVDDHKGRRRPEVHEARAHGLSPDGKVVPHPIIRPPRVAEDGQLRAVMRRGLRTRRRGLCTARRF